MNLWVSNLNNYVYFNTITENDSVISIDIEYELPSPTEAPVVDRFNHCKGYNYNPDVFLPQPFIGTYHRNERKNGEDTYFESNNLQIRFLVFLCEPLVLILFVSEICFSVTDIFLPTNTKCLSLYCGV